MGVAVVAPSNLTTTTGGRTTLTSFSSHSGAPMLSPSAGLQPTDPSAVSFDRFFFLRSRTARGPMTSPSGGFEQVGFQIVLYRRSQNRNDRTRTVVTRRSVVPRIKTYFVIEVITASSLCWVPDAGAVLLVKLPPVFTFQSDCRIRNMATVVGGVVAVMRSKITFFTRTD